MSLWLAGWLRVKHARLGHTGVPRCIAICIVVPLVHTALHTMMGGPSTGRDMGGYTPSAVQAAATQAMTIVTTSMRLCVVESCAVETLCIQALAVQTPTIEALAFQTLIVQTAVGLHVVMGRHRIVLDIIRTISIV